MKYLFFLLFTFALYSSQTQPLTTIQKWYKEERKLTDGRFIISGTLASISSSGFPHTRTIQITRFEKGQGVLFFTHKCSRKVNDFQWNPYASLTLCLPKTRRQITLEGKVEEVSPAEGEKYWDKLSLSKKFFFLPSHEIEKIQGEKKAQRKNGTSDKQPPIQVPMPATFLGYRLVPHQVIFYEMPLRKPYKKEILSLEKEEWKIVQSET